MDTSADRPKTQVKKKRARTIQENPVYLRTDSVPKSLDFSDYYSRSASISQIYNYSTTFLLQDDDPFDYEITNIDQSLFAIPEMSTFELW